MSKVTGWLGLAARSRQLVLGEDACVRAIRAGSVCLILLATDAGPNGAKKVRDKCAFYGVPITSQLTRQELGDAVGKQDRTVMGVTSPQLAKQILQSMQQDMVQQDSIGGDGI